MNTGRVSIEFTIFSTFIQKIYSYIKTIVHHLRSTTSQNYCASMYKNIPIITL